MQPPELREALPGYPLRLLRSKRKTLSLEVRPGLEVLVRAPLRLPLRDIAAFVYSRRGWIGVHWNKAPGPRAPEYSQAEEKALRKKAKLDIPPLLTRYCALLGVSYTRLTITGARTRFGSCNAKGGLSFSFRLLAYPKEAVEYVVLHEAAHLRQLNHSKAFYRLLDTHMPDHRSRAAQLKQPPQPHSPI